METPVKLLLVLWEGQLLPIPILTVYERLLPAVAAHPHLASCWALWLKKALGFLPLRIPIGLQDPKKFLTAYRQSPVGLFGLQKSCSLPFVCLSLIGLP